MTSLPFTGSGMISAYAGRCPPKSDFLSIDIYYDAVIACVRKAETILIFGPGEAKGELRKRIKKTGICGRIEATETFGQMTDRQIVAHVRRYFQASL